MDRIALECSAPAGAKGGGMVDEHLERKLRALASQDLTRRRIPPSELTPEEALRETVARYWARGGEEAVDPGKGTKESLLRGILANVVREVGKKRRAQHLALPVDPVDDKAPSPFEAAFGPVRRGEAERRNCLVREWWNGLSAKQRTAIARIKGEAMGWTPDRTPTNADYSAKHHAVARLIAMAEKRGIRLFRSSPRPAPPEAPIALPSHADCRDAR